MPNAQAAQAPNPPKLPSLRPTYAALSGASGRHVDDGVDVVLPLLGSLVHLLLGDCAYAKLPPPVPYPNLHILEAAYSINACVQVLIGSTACELHLPRHRMAARHE
eukprot:12326281-Alexandrium_andersonii.AAC.1